MEDKPSSFAGSLWHQSTFLIPGVVFGLGLYLILPHPTSSDQLPLLSAGSALFYIILCYFIGVLNSSASVVVGWLVFGRNAERIVRLFKKEVEDIKSDFGFITVTYETWSEREFYLVRTFLRDRSSNLAEYAERQYITVLLLRNSVIPLLVLFVVLCLKYWIELSCVSVLSLFIIFILLCCLIVCAMRHVKQNEIHEIVDSVRIICYKDKIEAKKKS
jgi:hypothetical protein